MSVDNIADLGIVRTASALYSDLCYSKASKAAKTAIRRIFRTRARELLWPAFQYYVLPIINYCSPVWSPILISDITIVERVQRRYTKRVRRLQTRPMCYADRLKSLETLSSHRYRDYLDMITIYKCLNGLINCTPSSLGLSVITSNVRGCGTRLVQRRIVSRTCSGIFPYRVPTRWNKLPLSITGSLTLFQFKKRRLFTYYMSDQ